MNCGGSRRVRSFWWEAWLCCLLSTAEPIIDDNHIECYSVVWANSTMKEIVMTK